MKNRINSFIAYFKNQPPKNFLALVALLIVTAAIPLTVFVSQQQQKTKQQAAEIIPSDSVDTEQTSPKIIIPDQAVEKRYNNFVERKTTTQPDLNARNMLIENLRTTLSIPTPSPVEGIIFQNSNVQVDYASDPDEFMAEIFSQDINLAKTQAEDWLTQQGLSKEGICNLPLVFLLSPEVVDLLPEDTVFDPNPFSCQ